MTEYLIAFFLIMGGGVFFQWKRPGNINADDLRHVINTIVIRFFFPALCFKVISTAAIDKNILLLPLSALITISLSILLSIAVYSVFSKSLGLSKKEKAVLILAASFGNVTFLGLPLLTGLYGEEAAKYVLLYDLLATTPMVWIAGVAIASSYGHGEKFSIRQSFKTIAELPPIWALVLGFAVNFAGIRLPEFLIKTLDLMSMPIIPLMIFSVGLALTVPKLKQTVTVVPAIVIKLCIVPLMAFAIASLLGMSGLALKASVMEAAMPTMVLTLVLASHYKLDHTLAALAIMLTTALSFITLPFVAYALKGF
ncbi:MAG: AEC family transporter [Endomicrobia bacterium]|nr:AEC family transporter [Endomicrobiia bacterium]